MVTTAPKRILVVDDDVEVRESLSRVIVGSGHVALKAPDGRRALEVLGRQSINVVVADLKMPGVNGFELLKAVKRVHPRVEVILISAHGTIEKAVEALKEGACDFIIKPFRRATICGAIDRALAHQNETAPTGGPETDADADSDFSGIVAQSEGMQRVFDMIRRVAPTWATVLVQGETGTGKELVAEAIHRFSSRGDRPMIAVSCAAIPEGLLEAELFGHERGAFTGAISRHRGRFELANGGTLFLDEVSQLSLATQAKLLRALQSSEFERVGGSETIKVDVRLIAATNIDLQEAVLAGGFREDLYYRLNVVKVHIPPLRKRPEDIPLLLDHFVRLYSARDGKHVAGATAEVLDALSAYDWAGNVRELENAVERAMVLTSGSILRIEDFPELPVRGGPPPSSITIPIGTPVAEAEKRLIEETVRYTRGDKTAAAHLLGIVRRTIYRKIQGG